MCNCGSRSQRMAAAQIGASASGVPRPDPRSRASLATVEFIYTGRTALTAVGPATGIVYRFIEPNARMQVDVRDAPAFAKIAVLRKS
jgi:hypothetical protein